MPAFAKATAGDVGVARFELATSDSRSQHATNCATPRRRNRNRKRKRQRKRKNLSCAPFQRCLILFLYLDSSVRLRHHNSGLRGQFPPSLKLRRTMSEWRDSNSRPPAPHADTLPTAPHPENTIMRTKKTKEGNLTLSFLFLLPLRFLPTLGLQI